MSDEPINLSAERSKREQPEPEFVKADEYGRPLYKFGYSFEHQSKEYGFDFWAYDAEDAQAKLASIRESAKFDGQIYGSIPA